MKSAKMAISAIAEMTTRPMNAPRFSRKAAQNAASGVGWARTSAASSLDRAGTATLAAMTDPRIDRAIDQVDDKVDADHHRRNQHHAALQGWVVAPADRFDQPMANPGPGKDRLGQHRAGEQARHHQADDGDDRQQGVAQRMHADDPKRRQALGAVSYTHLRAH